MAKRLDKEILALAWPAIATNITTPLLSLVDVAIVGHIGSAAYIGAVAVGGTMLNMLFWLFGFLRAGTSGFTAQAYGRGDRGEQVRTLVRALVVALVSGVILIGLSGSVGDAVLAFMDADGSTEELARSYFEVAIWGAPGLLATFALSGWFLGMQDSRPAMWMALMANTTNILLSVIFVFGAGMDIRGVGLGTAVAQWISPAIGFAMLRRRLRGKTSSGWQRGFWRGSAWLNLFKVNTDIVLRTVCLIAVTLWFTHSGAVSGDVVLAANSLLMQLFMLFSYFMDGFAYAGEALAGRFSGEADIQSLRRMVRTLLRWGVMLALLTALIYFVCGELLLKLLTKDLNVIKIATAYKYWAVAVPLAGFMSFLWDGIYIGLTRTRQMLLTMIIAMFVFYTAYFLTYPVLGNDGLWLAFILYLLTRGLMQHMLFIRSAR